MVEGSHPDGRQAMAQVILERQQVLGHLAHAVRRQRPQRGGLVEPAGAADRPAVLIGGAGHERAEQEAGFVPDMFQDFNGLRVGGDRMSAPYLQGAVIDFVDTIEKQGFTIDNPNATGSCACGDSFH